MKKIVSLFLFLGGIVNIQDAVAQTVNTNKELQAFNHLDFGVTLGTTGIGFDFATPICDFAQVRAGFSYMPEIKPTMHFGVQVGDDPTTSQSKFDKMSGMLESFIGHDVDNQIDMIGEPNFYNLSLMVDFFPIKNKNWHVTAGFHYGPSTIAKAYNTTEDMPSLLAVDMYNKMYDFFAEEKYLDEPILGEDNYIDPEIGDAMRDSLLLMAGWVSDLENIRTTLQTKKAMLFIRLATHTLWFLTKTAWQRLSSKLTTLSHILVLVIMEDCSRTTIDTK